MNDKYLSEHFKSDFWDVIRVGKKLYLQLEKGSHKAIFEYATEEFAEANYIDLIGVIKEYKAITTGSIPKIVATEEGGCSLVWEYQNEEEWEESIDLLTISIPHLTVQWSGIDKPFGITLWDESLAADWKEKFESFLGSSDKPLPWYPCHVKTEEKKEVSGTATSLDRGSALGDEFYRWNAARVLFGKNDPRELTDAELEKVKKVTARAQARWQKQNTDISGDHFFHGGQWFLYLQANRLYIGRQRGDRVVVCSYPSINDAVRHWDNLLAILSDRTWIVEADFPDIEKDENGDVLLTWADPAHGWSHHLTVNVTKAVVVGESLPAQVTVTAVKRGSPQDGPLHVLCHYATPRELCWHDGKRIEVHPGYADMYKVNPVEYNAVAKRNEELQEAALRELRRLSHCVFREWPTCSVSGEPVALTLRPFDFKTTSVVHGALICRHCNKDYQP